MAKTTASGSAREPPKELEGSVSSIAGPVGRRYAVIKLIDDQWRRFFGSTITVNLKNWNESEDLAHRQLVTLSKIRKCEKGWRAYGIRPSVAGR